MAVVKVKKGIDKTYTSSDTSDTFEIGGKAGSVEITTSGTVSLTADIGLSNSQSGWKTTSTAYTTVTTDIFQFGEGIAFLRFDVPTYSTGTVVFTLNIKS